MIDDDIFLPEDDSNEPDFQDDGADSEDE